MQWIKKCAFILVLFALLFSVQRPAYAQENTYTVDYNFDFYMYDNSTDIDVALSIVLTNLRSDIYITEYTLRLPKNFLFKDLKVLQSGKQVPFVVVDKDTSKNIIFKFDEPSQALTTNTIQLTYSIDDMHTAEGSINEIILPLLVSDQQAKVNATLHLPQNFEKKISLSKPIPTEINDRSIVWKDVKEYTIFGLFGTSQMYEVDLSYSLENTKLTSDNQIIALPPETLYQKVYMSSLEPKPLRTFTDDDGNFLAEYSVPSRSTLDISFNGFVEVFIRPQSTLRNHIRDTFTKQQSYLLTEEDMWSLGEALQDVSLDQLETSEDVYHYTRDILSYSTSRLRQDPSRYGAEKALYNPSKAVCMEYTDLFIALAREKGIPAREVQGYGYSRSQTIRPSSLVQDVLHAWPEYYDRQQELWIPVDPTWEDTSGIDYYSALDVNHIALVLHGQDPLEPKAAGFYKTEARKDVNVTIPTNKKPQAITKLDIQHDIRDSLSVGKTYSATVEVTNTGNAFIHDIFVVPEAQSISFEPDSLHISFLAPMETREIPISFTPQEGYSHTDKISFVYDGAVLGEHDVNVASQRSRTIIITFGAIGIGLILSILFIIIRKK